MEGVVWCGDADSIFVNCNTISERREYKDLTKARTCNIFLNRFHWSKKSIADVCNFIFHFKSVS